MQSRAGSGVALPRRAGVAAAAVAAAAVALCCAAVMLAGAGSEAGGRRVSLDAVRGRAGAALGGKALADVRQMYEQNPAAFKEFVTLTGSRGQALLSQVVGPAKPAPPRVFKGPSLHTLDAYMHQLSALTSQAKRETEEQVRDWQGGAAVPATAEEATRLGAWKAFATADVNKRTAWMMVNDLSQDWDKSSNYSTTPWEFCAGRNLSPRQIRECTGHLIRVAGVHSHRDLNVNAKIYDRFCTGDGHQYIDKYGSPIFLPVGSRKMCAKVTTPRSATGPPPRSPARPRRPPAHWHAGGSACAFTPGALLYAVMLYVPLCLCRGPGALTQPASTPPHAQRCRW